MVANTRMLTLGADWTQVSLDGAAECSITLEGTRALQAVVQVQASKPPSTETEGVRLTALAPSCPISGLAPTQKVWARALNGAARISVH